MPKMKKILGLGFLGVVLLFSGCKIGVGASNKCPSIETFKRKLDTLQPGLQVEKIEASQIEGLCKVIVKLSEFDRILFYTDSKGNYIISGNIIDIENKKNLVQEELENLNRRVLDPSILSKIDGLVDITYGSSPNLVYFITDPDCPFCKKAESILDKLVKEGKISVKVVLLPLEKSHPEAKKKSISLICDKKGFEDLMKGYQSSNQCKNGLVKIERNIDFLINQLKITGTPTFIFPDGEVKTGVVSEEYILNKFVNR